MNSAATVKSVNVRATAWPRGLGVFLALTLRHGPLTRKGDIHYLGSRTLREHLLTERWSGERRRISD